MAGKYGYHLGRKYWNVRDNKGRFDERMGSAIAKVVKVSSLKLPSIQGDYTSLEKKNLRSQRRKIGQKMLDNGYSKEAVKGALSRPPLDWPDPKSIKPVRENASWSNASKVPSKSGASDEIVKNSSTADLKKVVMGEKPGDGAMKAAAKAELKRRGDTSIPGSEVKDAAKKPNKEVPAAPGVVKTFATNKVLPESSKYKLSGKPQEVTVDGEVIGYLSKGRVGAPVMDGRVRVGWQAESSGWLMFNKNGSRIQGQFLTESTKADALAALQAKTAPKSSDKVSTMKPNKNTPPDKPADRLAQGYLALLRKNSAELAETVKAMESGRTPDTEGTLPFLKENLDHQLSEIKRVEALIKAQHLDEGKSPKDTAEEEMARREARAGSALASADSKTPGLTGGERERAAAVINKLVAEGKLPKNTTVEQLHPEYARSLVAADQETARQKARNAEARAGSARASAADRERRQVKAAEDRLNEQVYGQGTSPKSLFESRKRFIGDAISYAERNGQDRITVKVPGGSEVDMSLKDAKLMYSSYFGPGELKFALMRPLVSPRRT